MSIWDFKGEIYRNKLSVRKRKHGGGYFATHQGKVQIFQELEQARKFAADNAYAGIVVEYVPLQELGVS